MYYRPNCFLEPYAVKAMSSAARSTPRIGGGSFHGRLAALRRLMKTYLLVICCVCFHLARAGDLPVDEKLAQNAVAVLRVKLIFANDHGTNWWTDNQVHTIQIFKNESHTRIADIGILSIKGRAGVPKEECTVYLQRWDFGTGNFSNDKDVGRWILVGGDATNGVSHVEMSDSK